MRMTSLGDDADDDGGVAQRRVRNNPRTRSLCIAARKIIARNDRRTIFRRNVRDGFDLILNQWRTSRSTRHHRARRRRHRPDAMRTLHHR